MTLIIEESRAMPDKKKITDMAWSWDELTTTVTPAMARMFLENKAPNRSVSRNHVERLKRDILNGNWAAAPNVLAFDVDGRLIDGQHRCAAIVEADKSVPCILIAGFAPSTIDVLDVGRKRTLADVLAIKGASNSVAFAAVARIVSWYCTAPLAVDFYGMSKATNSEVMKEMQAPARQDAIQEAIRVARLARPVCAESYMGAVMYLGCASRLRWGYGEEFCAAIGTGENLSADDPRLLLRNRMMQTKAAKMTISKKAQFVLIAKAWNAWISGKKLTKLVVAKDVDDVAVPAVDGCPREIWPEDVVI